MFLKPACEEVGSMKKQSTTILASEEKLSRLAGENLMSQDFKKCVYFSYIMQKFFKHFIINHSEVFSDVFLSLKDLYK